MHKLVEIPRFYWVFEDTTILHNSHNTSAHALTKRKGGSQCNAWSAQHVYQQPLGEQKEGSKINPNIFVSQMLHTPKQLMPWPHTGNEYIFHKQEYT